MSLDLYFFKNDIDIKEIRANISDLYEKRRIIQDKIKQLEDDYDDALLYSVNITHNLNKMAQQVGLYEVLWRPEEIDITFASQMILPLEKGIKELEAYPEKYKTLNPPDGLGSYDDFVAFCKSVLLRCRKYPDAVIEAGKQFQRPNICILFVP